MEQTQSLLMVWLEQILVESSAGGSLSLPQQGVQNPLLIGVGVTVGACETITINSEERSIHE